MAMDTLWRGAIDIRLVERTTNCFIVSKLLRAIHFEAAIAQIDVLRDSLRVLKISRTPGLGWIVNYFGNELGIKNCVRPQWLKNNF